MKLIVNPVSCKARIVILPNSKRVGKNPKDFTLVSNKKPKQNLLTKVMTKIIKPYFKTLLKDPS